MADERREAVEQMKRDKATHDLKSGKLPSSREIERWGNDLGRRNDRQDSDGASRRR